MENQYAEGSIRMLNMRDHIRLRPAMYIRGLDRKGFRDMIHYLLEDLLENVSEKVEMEFIFLPGNRTQIKIQHVDIPRFRRQLSGFYANVYGNTGLHGHQGSVSYHIPVVISLSSLITISVCDGHQKLTLRGEKGEFTIEESAFETVEPAIFMDFIADPEIFKNMKINYQDMNLLLQQWAYLNPVKIVSKDQTSTEGQRIVFDYPRGIVEAIDLEISKWYYGEILLRTSIKAMVDDCYVQIGICFSSCWTDPGLIRTYANDREMIFGGSLKEGILSGLDIAIQEIRRENGLKKQIKRKKIVEQLVVIASVKGPTVVYKGSIRCELDMPQLRKGVMQLVIDHMAEFFQSNPEDKKRLLGILED